MSDIDVGQISEALNNKIDIDGYNSNTTTPVGLNANGTRTVVEVSDKSLLPSWYRVYSDGWCEQGGRTSSVAGGYSTTVAFTRTFKDTNYTIYAQNIDEYTSQGEANCCISSITTTGFTVYSGNYSSTIFSWKASGYLAAGQY